LYWKSRFRQASTSVAPWPGTRRSAAAATGRPSRSVKASKATASMSLRSPRARGAWSARPPTATAPTACRNSRRCVLMSRSPLASDTPPRSGVPPRACPAILLFRLSSMHFRMKTIDWDDLRFLLSLSRHGTLTAAAADLGVTQPTVGRRLVGLERRLGSKLFRSAPQGAELTSAGEMLVGRAQRMEAEAL